MKKYLVFVEITNVFLKFFKVLDSQGRRAGTKNNFCKIESMNDDEIVKVLKTNPILNKGKVREVRLILSSQFALMKQMKIPSHDETEIKQIISLKLVNEIPIPPQDIVFDFYVIEKEESGFSRVLLFVVKKEVCARLISLFKKAGIIVDKITLSSLCLLDWYIYNYFDEGVSVVINFDFNVLEICFCLKDKLIFARNILVDSNESYDNYPQSVIPLKDTTEVKSWGFIDELKQTFDFYHKEKIGPLVKRLIIISRGNCIERFKEEIQKSINIPIICEHSFKDDEILGEKEGWDGVSFVVCQGACSSDENFRINLIPKEEEEARIRNSIRKNCVKKIFILLLTIVFFMSGSFFVTAEKKRELKNILDEIQLLSEQQEKSERIIRFTVFLQEELNLEVFAPSFFAELIKLIPDDILITSLNIDAKNQISIQGYAKQEKSVNNFRDALMRSEFFQEVNAQYISKKYVSRKDVVDFKISSKMNSKI